MASAHDGSEDAESTNDRTDPGLARILAAGSEFVGIVAVMSLLGYWLDATLGTAPWLLVVFAFTGFASATWLLFRALTAAERAEGRKS